MGFGQCGAFVVGENEREPGNPINLTVRQAWYTVGHFAGLPAGFFNLLLQRGGHQDCASAWGDFTDGLSRWLFGNKYGFINRAGKTVIQPEFDLTYGFSEGLTAVQIGKKWGYIDTTGTIVITALELRNAKPFHKGLAEVQTSDWSIGYIDRSGKYVWGPYKRNDAASE